MDYIRLYIPTVRVTRYELCHPDQAHFYLKSHAAEIGKLLTYRREPMLDIETGEAKWW